MISPLNSSFLRGLLRIYFVFAFIFLGLIGSQCLKTSAKVNLLKGKSVRLNKMTGWISGPSLIKAIWQLRCLPGGVIFGLIMIVASILTLAADFATNTLVYQKNVFDRCKFDEGLVIDSTIKWWDIPPYNSAAAVVAANAQIFSTINGGHIGIYAKSSYVPDFAAAERDLMGWWTCTEEVGKDVNYTSYPEVGGYDDNAIALDLVELGLQYPGPWMTSDSSAVGSTAHLIVWSASAVDGDLTPFDVRVSIDQGSTYGQPKPMKNYRCAVDPSSSHLSEVNHILSTMQPNGTMSTWVSGLSASIYNGLNSGPNTAETPSLLAQTLNTMTMVQGGYGSILSKPKEGEDQTYGCLVAKTYISIVVIVLAGTVGAMLLGVFFFWMLQLCRLGSHSLPGRKSRGARSAVRPLPDGLVSWMLQATRESTFGQQERVYGGVRLDDGGVPEKDRETKQWKYKIVEDGNGGEKFARLVRKGGEGVVRGGEQATGYMSSYPPTPSPQPMMGGGGIRWDGKHGAGVPLVAHMDGRGSP